MLTETYDAQKKIVGKRRLFIENYTRRGSKTYHNGNQSAIAAGYAPKGARNYAVHLLANSNVRAAIQAKEDADNRAVEMTKEGLLNEARFRIAHATTWPERRYYTDLLVRLSGWEVARTEVTNIDVTSEMVNQIECFLKRQPGKLDSVTLPSLVYTGAGADTEITEVPGATTEETQ